MTIDTSREAVELRQTRLRAAYEEFRAPYGHIAALITQAKLTEKMMDALLAERDEYRDQIAELLPAVNREAVELCARAEAAEARARDMHRRAQSAEGRLSRLSGWVVGLENYLRGMPSTHHHALTYARAALRFARPDSGTGWALNFACFGHYEKRWEQRATEALAERDAALAEVARLSTPADAEAHLTSLLRAEYERGKYKARLLLAGSVEETINNVLRYYRQTEVCDENGDGYPLVDALTLEGHSIDMGIREVESIADTVAGAILALLTQEGR